MTLAAIYTRISHDPYGNEAGVTRQEEDCRALASRSGWSILEPIYKENDVSASTNSRRPRPVFDQMLEDIGPRSIDVVVAYSASRLTRRPLEYERLIELVRTRGVRFQTVVSGPVQLDTADGRAIARMLAAIDAAESERQSERLIRMWAQRAARGLWNGGGTPPVGYRVVAHGGGMTLRVDSERATLVQELADRLLDGWSLLAICRDWHMRGISNSRGRPWDSAGIRCVFKKPFVAGFTESQGRRYVAGWPGIISLEKWQQVHDLLHDPGRLSRRSGPPLRRVLDGILFCGRCGQELKVHNTNGTPTYLCATTPRAGCGRIAIQANHVERYLLERLQGRRAHRGGQGSEAGTTIELQRIQDDFYDGLMTREDYLRQCTRYGRPGPTEPAQDAAELTEHEARQAIMGGVQRVDVAPTQPGQSIGGRRTWAEKCMRLDYRLSVTWL